MAFLECNCFSETLRLSVSFNVILPQPTQSQIGMTGTAGAGDHPVIYLLHGLSDDHTIWMRRTSIERYAAPLGLAVIMPAVHRSFYNDMQNDYRYWTYVSEELPALARSFFPITDKREKTFVAGLSMGGYGAFKLALRKPEMFAAAAGFSGALDFRHVLRKDSPLSRNERATIFADPDTIEGTDNDLFHLAEGLANNGKDIPMLYQSCGTKDPLYDGNIRFRNHLKSLNINVNFHEEDTAHTWDFWDREIEKVLRWLPLNTPGK